jgi:hypothetical protein
MSEPRTERHLALAWSDQLAGAIQHHMAHPAAGLADPGTECVLAQVLDAPTRHHTGYPTPQEHPMAVARTHPADTHHVPAALQQAHAKPPPIPFPARPANARATTPSQATVERWERQRRQLEDARVAGLREGLRIGHKQAWRRGAITGLIWGVVLTTLAWSAYLSIAAPEVAPPSAAQPTLL